METVLEVQDEAAAKPLRTAAEIAAEVRVEQPVRPAEFPRLLLPADEEVEEQARICGGGNTGFTRNRMTLDLRSRWERLSRICPVVFAEMVADVRVAEEALARVKFAMSLQPALVNELVDLLKGRADLRLRREKTVELHKTAVATLADHPSCADLDNEELLRLHAEREHLPARIQAMQTEVDRLSEQIQAKALVARTDVKTVIAALYAESAPGDHVRRLVDGGWLDLAG